MVRALSTTLCMRLIMAGKSISLMLGVHTHGSGILDGPDNISRIDEHLGRDAAVVQTGAARWALIHQSDL